MIAPGYTRATCNANSLYEDDNSTATACRPVLFYVPVFAYTEEISAIEDPHEKRMRQLEQSRDWAVAPRAVLPLKQIHPAKLAVVRHITPAFWTGKNFRKSKL